MQEAAVFFSRDDKGLRERSMFIKRCEDPKFVIECLSKYQRWRKGIGEFEWNGDPSNQPHIPFSSEALSIVEDSAIMIIRKFMEIRNGGCHEIE